MTPDALRAAPAALGLSGRGLARLLHVNEKTWRRWVAGQVPIPRSVALAVQAMLDGWQPKPEAMNNG
jgi:hypothetical protein